jgi:hypothetical protein
MRCVPSLVPSPCPNDRKTTVASGIERSTDMRADLHQRMYGEGRAAQRPTFQAGHAGSIPVTRSRKKSRHDSRNPPRAHGMSTTSPAVGPSGFSCHTSFVNPPPVNDSGTAARIANFTLDLGAMDRIVSQLRT